MAKVPLALYKKYHLDRDDDRLGLFRLLADHYPMQSALYPGSFVHLTPSLLFPLTTYVDSDKRALHFFSDEAVSAYIHNNKEYSEDPQVAFHLADYQKDLQLPDAHFDLLISQYAGFISRYCTRYLKIGGMLLANNSHGDASMASIDSRYQLEAVINRRGTRFSMKTSDLDTYLIPKSGKTVTQEGLLASGRGAGYTRPAGAYLFRRVS